MDGKPESAARTTDLRGFTPTRYPGSSTGLSFSAPTVAPSIFSVAWPKCLAQFPACRTCFCKITADRGRILCCQSGKQVHMCINKCVEYVIGFSRSMGLPDVSKQDSGLLKGVGWRCTQKTEAKMLMIHHHTCYSDTSSPRSEYCACVQLAQQSGGRSPKLLPLLLQKE